MEKLGQNKETYISQAPLDLTLTIQLVKLIINPLHPIVPNVHKRPEY